MRIHEYQTKELFTRFGVPVPAGRVASTPEEAQRIAAELKRPVIVKAQVHVGGRGKAGGIRPADTPVEAARAAREILGMDLKGLRVARVLVEEALDAGAEYYLGITVDRAKRRDVVIVSSVGGVDIEDVAATTPEKIARALLDPALGLLDFQIRRLAREGGLLPSTHPACARLLHALHRCYQETDATLAEINPLVLTRTGELIAADAKVSLDDSALYRHPELAEWRQDVDEDPVEAEAYRRGLTYVRLDGDIGIIGNGAGLVMTTLDIVQREGGKPANFLDVGGGATADKVRLSLDTVLLDGNVKGILVNIFGGITRCDEVARGVVEATARLDRPVPLVVRLTGTREEEGQRMLAGAGLFPVDSMQEAARKMVALVSS